eukprot:3893264-Lingulodinium_polyedra.AAC.1
MLTRFAYGGQQIGFDPSVGPEAEPGRVGAAPTSPPVGESFGGVDVGYADADPGCSREAPASLAGDEQ